MAKTATAPGKQRKVTHMDLTEENTISLGMLIGKKMMLTPQDMMPHLGMFVQWSFQLNYANNTRRFFGLAERVQKNKSITNFQLSFFFFFLDQRESKK